jgi:hypothetical protein
VEKERKKERKKDKVKHIAKLTLHNNKFQLYKMVKESLYRPRQGLRLRPPYFHTTGR